MLIHRVLGGLIHDPALLQAVALGYESDDVLLAASAKRTSTGSAAAARAQEARPVGRTPVAHCTVSVPCHVCMGLRTVHRLRVCVSTFTCMLACVTGLSSGHGTVRIQLSDRWFGPRVSRVRVYVPRAYLFRVLGSRCVERHELACALWDTRANCGTFGVGRGSDMWDLMQKFRSDRFLGALGGVRAEELIYGVFTAGQKPLLLLLYSRVSYRRQRRASTP